jgi:hypothetical protein
VRLPYGRYAVTIGRRGFETTDLIGFSVDTSKPPVLRVVLEVNLPRCVDYCGDQDIDVVPTVPSDLPSVIPTNIP